MELTEKKLTSKDIYKGYVVHLTVDEVELPDGNTSIREVVHHNGAVCVVALDDDGSTYMVRQYRYAQGRDMLEIPAGKLDSPDEDWELAARRELREEVGVTCEKLTYLGDYTPDVALLAMSIHTYLAQGLIKGEQDLDEDEFLNVEKYRFDDIVKMVTDGKITDGKTVCAILKTKFLLG